MTKNITSLHNNESFFYFFIWTSAIIYSIYELSSSENSFSEYHDLYDDFAPGWSFIGKKQDVSDYEWRVWIPLIMTLLPWIFFYNLIAWIIKTTLSSWVLQFISLIRVLLLFSNMFPTRLFSLQLLYCWYIFLPTAFLCYYIGPLGMLCTLAQPSLLYFLTYNCNKWTIWLVQILFLFVIHFLKIPDGIFQSVLGFNDEEHYILTLTMCWIQLRSISYNLDSLEDSLTNKSDDSFVRNLLQKLAYCLYLPTMSLGPLIQYHEFMDSTRGPFESWNWKRLRSFSLNLARYMFWIYFSKFVLHHVYFNAIQYHPEIVQGLNPWALYGLGYCMGQFFLIKYVVVYGLNKNLCAIDDIKAPPQPKCIGRIHLYSDMWKYFDRGLYKFLVRYIYGPAMASNLNKIFASFLCFTFVFIWHGMQMNIFIWSFLNFIGLTIESIATSIGKTEQYSKIQKRYLSLRNARRFNCILATPLLAMSAISNFYFFAGSEIGNIFVQRLIHESWKALFLLHFFLYCCCQVSLDVRKWESR